MTAHLLFIVYVVAIRQALSMLVACMRLGFTRTQTVPFIRHSLFHNTASEVVNAVSNKSHCK